MDFQKLSIRVGFVFYLFAVVFGFLLGDSVLNDWGYRTSESQLIGIGLILAFWLFGAFLFFLDKPRPQVS